MNLIILIKLTSKDGNNYQTRFWYLPGALKSLVFNANYTMSTSQVKYLVQLLLAILTLILLNTFKKIMTVPIRWAFRPANEIINVSLGYDYKGFQVDFHAL